MTTDQQTTGPQVTISFPGESAEYRRARVRLLEQEIEPRRVTEEVAQAPRDLPACGLVPDHYRVEDLDEDGRPREVKLSDLFGHDIDSLVVYSMMFPRTTTDTRPGAASGVTSGLAPHARERLNLVVVAKAPAARVGAVAHERSRASLRVLSIRHFWGSELLYEPSEPVQESRHVRTIEPLWNLFELRSEGRPGDWAEQFSYCCTASTGDTP